MTPALRSLWVVEGPPQWSVEVIDQRRLPHEFATLRLDDVDAAARAIADMAVRGAPLIGVTAAYGLALAVREDASDEALGQAYERLLATRPTAVNLRWALDDVREALRQVPVSARAAAAFARAQTICAADVATCHALGVHGAEVLQALSAGKPAGEPVQVLTHCNAGWLATVEHGTALAPLYEAQRRGVRLHVWVDETRPRNQGASLTAWELARAGIDHTVIVDNAGGLLMQRGRVDVVFVGGDRTTSRGDVCNKVGTYLKALAARAHGVPFYVVLPSSTIDWDMDDGVKDMPIEERHPREVTEISGRCDDGVVRAVRLVPDGTRAANFAFDVTPASLVTGLVTERGVCRASHEGLLRLFPERAR